MYYSVIVSIADLPSQPVDLVIDALLSNESNEFEYDQMITVVDWANRNKAPVLALDPCIRSKQGANTIFCFRSFFQLSVFPFDPRISACMFLPL